MAFIEKNTNQDKSSILSTAVRGLKNNSDSCCYSYSPWMLDFDDNYVYYDAHTDSGYKTFRVSYSYNGTSATLGSDRTEVVRMTEYKEVVNTEKSSEASQVISLLKSFLDKFSSPVKEPVILKAFDEEQMIAIEPLYIAAGEVDLHGDTLELDTVKEMVANFNKANEEYGVPGNLMHRYDTDKFKIVKAWVTEEECILGDEVVPAGQPVAEVQFLCKAAWKMRKEGRLCGLSIGAHAEWEEVDE